MKTRLLVIEQWHIRGLGAAVRIQMKLKRGSEQRQANNIISFFFTFPFPSSFFFFFINSILKYCLWLVCGGRKEKERVLR